MHAIRLHSVAVATLAQRIAPTSPCGLDPELAYCAGLLHDLGVWSYCTSFHKNTISSWHSSPTISRLICPKWSLTPYRRFPRASRTTT